jgi:hypothetical protein
VLTPRFPALAAALGLALVSASARADTSLGPQGSEIRTSNYTIDLYEGPVLAGARVVGLGGAYVPIAQGVSGYVVNPAAVAHRVPWSVDWFDWEVDGGITLPSSVTNFDFDNSGDDKYANSAAFFGTVGGGLQFGPFGIGLNLDLQKYRVASLEETEGEESEDQTLDVDVWRILLVGGWAFFHNQLVFGAGIGLNTISITRPGLANTETREVATVNGAAGYLGAIWAPKPLPVRFGASVRGSPQASFDESTKPQGPDVVEDEEGNFTSRGYYLPRTISLPSEVQVGMAVQLFRPLNFYFADPRRDRYSQESLTTKAIAAERSAWQGERRRRQQQAAVSGQNHQAVEAQLEREDERRQDAWDDRLDAAKAMDRRRRLGPYRGMPREKLLISAALKLTTITTNGVGLESFLRQRVARSGENVSFSPRLGVEAEAVPGWLVLRGGSYYEPTRFRAPAGPRVHGTGGFDVRIPIEWSVFGLFDDDNTFRVGGAIDVTARYFGWGVSAGIWR